MKMFLTNIVRYCLLGSILILLPFVKLHADDEASGTPSVPLSALQYDEAMLKDILSSMGYENFTVARISPSGSMRPALNDYDYVVIYKTPYDDLKLNDILLRADYRGTIACHRLSMEGGSSHLTKGDNNLLHDPGFLSEKYYRGKVVLIIENDLGEHPVDVLRGAKYVLAQRDAKFFGED